MRPEGALESIPYIFFIVGNIVFFKQQQEFLFIIPCTHSVSKKTIFGEKKARNCLLRDYFFSKTSIGLLPVASKPLSAGCFLVMF